MITLRFLSISIFPENSENMTAVIEAVSGVAKRTSIRNEPVLGSEICWPEALKSGVRSTASKA